MTRGLVSSLMFVCVSAGCALPSMSPPALQGASGRAQESPAARQRSTVENIGIDNGADFPTGASTVPSGTIQVEVDSVLVTTRSPSEAIYSLPVLFRIGVAEKTELRLGGSAFNYNESPDGDTSGAGPVSIGAKYRFFHGGDESLVRPTAFALLATFLLPVVSSDFVHRSARTPSAARLQPALSMNFDYDFPGNWSAALNLGASAPSDDDDDLFLQGFVEWSVTYSILERLGLYATGSSAYPFDAAETGAANLIGGGWTWYIGRSYALFGAYNVGTNRYSPDVNANFGFAISF